VPLGFSHHDISVSKSISSGYRYNTAFDRYSASYTASVNAGGGDINAYIGYKNNDFGANDFYIAGFHDATEHTTSLFTVLSARYPYQAIRFNPKIYWRKHTDDYILDTSTPSLYRNRTRTDVVGGEVQSLVDWDGGTTALGVEGSREMVESNDLDSHNRYKGGIFSEHVLALFNKRLHLIPGASLYYYSKWKWKFFPGLDIGFHYNDNIDLFATGGYSFRVPTFTELYYDSPGNRGDEKLQPERTVSAEAGLSFSYRYFSGQASLFARVGYDIIDWIRREGTRQWMAKNLAVDTAYGLDFSGTVPVEIKVFPFEMSLGYSALDIQRNTTRAREDHMQANVPTGGDSDTVDYEYKYGYHYLRHKLVYGATFDIGSYVSNSWRVRYEIRDGENRGVTLVDTRFLFIFHGMRFFVDIQNMFDTEYADIGFIPMPGRWIRGGVELAL
jgi:iron complex outermembrane receptor protein